MYYGKVRTHSTTGRKKSKDELISSIYEEFKYHCKCSHSVYIPNNVDRVLCRYCNHYVYRTKELEFKYKLKEKLRHG